jgi:hypothetical protein
MWGLGKTFCGYEGGRNGWMSDEWSLWRALEVVAFELFYSVMVLVVVVITAQFMCQVMHKCEADVRF